MPSVEYFAHWLHHETMMIEAFEHYQKRSWRNKTCILSPGEPHALTIPLQKGKHQQLPIREVRIAYDEPWMDKQAQALQTAYGKTAFGEEILEGVIPILQFGLEHLWDLNLALLNYIISLLPGNWEYAFTKEFEKEYAQDIIDLRQGIASGVTLMHSIPTYPQVQRIGKTFQPNLTILDVLCHLGPGTLDYLEQYAAKLYPTV
jgi:hypothetical protein